MLLLQLFTHQPLEFILHDHYLHDKQLFAYITRYGESLAWHTIIRSL